MTNPTQPLSLTARFSIEAAAGKGARPKIHTKAYSGNIMRITGWGAVAVDLTGLAIPERVLILAAHDDRLAGIVGSGTAEVRDNALYLEGVLTTATRAGELLIALAREGIEFQASVGVEPTGDIELVRAGENVEVNGQILEAPAGGLRVIRIGRLREVSVLPLGADAETSVTIAARKEIAMPQEPNQVVDEIRAAEAQETERVEAVRQLCAGAADRLTEARRANIEAGAIRDGWTAQRTELEILRAARAAPPAIRPSREGEPRQLLAAAALLRAGCSALAVEHYGEQITESAEHLPEGRSLIDLCRASLRMEGLEPPRQRNEMIRAAFSTSSLSVALGDAAEKVLVNAYQESPATWQTFCGVQSASNFKTHSAIRPSWGGSMEEVGGGGELKHGTMDEAVTEFSVSTFGKILKLSRKSVINDDMGFLDETARAYGRMAARGVSDLIWETILANAASFFSGAHANDLGATALSVDAFDSAVQAMRIQRDAENNDLDIQPAVLVVSPELETTARGILESVELAYSAGELTSESPRPTGNALRAAAQLVVEPRISNTAKFDDASTTAWYLFAGPVDSPVVVAFLNGVQNPTVESFGLDADINLLALGWRVYLDYGVALNDYRAAVKSDGA